MATKGMPEGAEKVTTEKATQPKAMDIHPVGTAPTVAGGKSVVVGNKSMATDPMLSVNKPQEVTETAQDESGAGAATTAPVINRHVKTISPISSEDTDEPLEQENDAVAKSVERIKNSKTKAEETATNTDGTSQASEATRKASNESDETAEEAKADTPEATENVELEPSEGATLPVEEDTASQEKTAEQMREDQLDELIQKKTYVVPIDKTGHRRHNAMLALLLVIVALVVTINFLLDLGVITIPGAPSTDIFARTSL
ncbi:MAG: hypothetical protein WAS36_05090 [Candidatus Saccharimonadales bacterium]